MASYVYIMGRMARGVIDVGAARQQAVINFQRAVFANERRQAVCSQQCSKLRSAPGAEFAVYDCLVLSLQHYCFKLFVLLDVIKIIVCYYL